MQLKPNLPKGPRRTKNFYYAVVNLLLGVVNLLPCPSFPCFFFWKMARTTTKKTRIFYAHRTPQIPGKEGKNAQKKQGILTKVFLKKQGIPKKQGKEGQGIAYSDLLPRRTVCGCHFPGNCRHLSPQRGVHGVVNLGGRCKNTTA